MKRFEKMYDQEQIDNITNEIIKESTNEDGTIDLQKVEEGIFKKIVGGVAGFTIGPSIGKVIAKALGIEKGVLYDMLTSRLVGTALGTAISKGFKK